MAYLRSAGLFEVNAPSIVRGIFPEPGGDDLDEEALAVEDLLDLGDALERARPVEVGRDDVVVVELDGVESEFLVGLELAGVLHLLADRRAEGVGAGADVPGSEGEAVLGGGLRRSS